MTNERARRIQAQIEVVKSSPLRFEPAPPPLLRLLRFAAVRERTEQGKAIYELNQGGHHDHLVCLQCGRVEEFYDPEIEKRQSDVARQRGFELHAHSLALYADCTKKNCPFRGR